MKPSVTPFGRCPALFALEAALFVAWSEGWLRRMAFEMYVGSLTLLGPGRPVRLGPLRYMLGEHRYIIVDTCTPVYLCAAGFALLALARVTVTRYLAACAVLFTGAAAAMCVNNAASMRLRPMLGWHLAHRPSLTAIYVLAYLLCLAWILRSRRAMLFGRPGRWEVPYLPRSAGGPASVPSPTAPRA